ncbi:MAG: PhoH family protein [Acidimicrobiales bacterium]
MLPKTGGQKRYIDAIRSNIVTFGIGPAGTGKSWLAVACAVAALQAKEVDRILLTRPAVEAGERLGYLPGDLMSKVDPYLRPLYDALHDMVGAEGMAKLFERNAVEVAPPLMRGRTLSDSFIILDEAQNTTPEQMKMFLLHRLQLQGRGHRRHHPGRCEGSASGLLGVHNILQGVENMAFVRLDSRDVAARSCRTSSTPTVAPGGPTMSDDPDQPEGVEPRPLICPTPSWPTAGCLLPGSMPRPTSRSTSKRCAPSPSPCSQVRAYRRDGSTSISSMPTPSPS